MRIPSTIAISISIVGVAAALLPSKSWDTNGHKRRRKTPANRHMTMYFDDVSRSTGQWKEPLSLTGFTTRHSPFSNQSPAQEKADAVERMLLGFNADSASSLSEEEIISNIEIWAQKSGVVGSYFGDELFEEISGLTVCNATSPMEGLAQFWEAIVDVIDTYSDPHYPRRWMMKDFAGSRHRAFFCIFPNCHDLYDYKNMFNFVASVEFSKELCLHLGNRFSLQVFHPKYKMSPKLFSPERHSPFPCAALQFESTSQLKTKPTVGADSPPPKKKPIRAPARRRISNDDDDDDDDIDAIVGSKIRDLDERRLNFELLFNNAAASGVIDGNGPSKPTPLSTATSNSNMLPDCSTKEVKEKSKSWIAASRKYFDPETGNMKQNGALQFVDSVPDERWIVSDHKLAERVYAQIWRAIFDLYNPTSSQDGNSKNSISGLMFVTTKFCAFNAQAFKKFAITVNAVLKRMTNGRMFIEVFHPEYVGNNGYNSNLRRSPYPMILVCFDSR